MTCSRPVLSFAAIVQGRDSSVRVTDDGLGDIIDVVMVFTGKDCNHANACFRALNPSLFDNQKVVIRNGRRYASLRDIITLIMVLPGKIAKEIRSQFAQIIENYIRENLWSQDDEQIPDQVGFKRKREELEMLRMEMEINAMRVNCYKQEEEARSMAQARILAATAELERIRNPALCNLDDRTRLMIQDSLQNSLLNTQFTLIAGNQQAAMITDGASSSTKINDNAPISISSVAQELGYKLTSADAKRIGIDIKKRYLQQRGQAPPKHDQLCEGRVTQVNSYTARDRPILVKALRAYFSPPASLSGESVGSGESTIEIP